MRVHPFDVTRLEGSVDLVEIFEEISRAELGDRVRTVGYHEVRAEDVAHHRGLWFLDFIKFRFDHAPGKAHRERPVEGFDFRDDEGAAEETAMLYDPRARTAIIQYNHYGVRPGAVAAYLSAYSRSPGDGFSFSAKYDLEAERRFMEKRFMKRLEYSIVPSKLQAGDRLARRSLTRALDFGREANAGSITITLSAGSHSRGFLHLDTVMDTVQELRGLFRRNQDAVSRLEVSGKRDSDDVLEVLDLLEPRLMLDVPVSPGIDLRLPRRARWEALEIAHSHWRRQSTRGG